MGLDRVTSMREMGAAPVDQIDQIPEKFQKKYTSAMEVGVAAKIISISDLDIANGTFSADLNLNVAWNGSEDDKPDVQFYNLAGDADLDEAAPKKAPAGKGWDWFYRTRCRGTFRQVYELRDFPFDKQELMIDVRLKKECKLVQLPWGPGGEAASCDPRCVSDEFHLVGAGVRHKYLPSYKFGDLAGYDPEATLVFKVERKPVFWVVNYGVIASAVCTLVALCYAIPAESIDARLGVAMTLVLTMTATKYLMMEKLPSVAYFTKLDIHVVFCCFFLLFLTLEIGLAAVIGAEKLEMFERLLFLPVASVIWVVYHVYVYMQIRDSL